MIELTTEQLLCGAGIKSRESKLFYLATPYSHEDPVVRGARFHMACDVTGFLMAHGLHVFSPIAHTHPIACRCDLPKGFDFWEKYDRCILSRCTDLLLLKADGWRESRGVQAERRIALELGLRIHFVWYPDFRDWWDVAEGTL